MNRWAKNVQIKADRLCEFLDRECGIWAMPIIMTILLVTIPVIFIEYTTKEKKDG